MYSPIHFFMCAVKAFIVALFSARAGIYLSQQQNK